MCVIILGEKKHIPLDILKKAEQSNPHGAGLAWINEKKQVEYIMESLDKLYNRLMNDTN